MRWPEAMIGLPTGNNIGSFVIDIDAGLDPKTGKAHSIDDLVIQIERVIGAELPKTVAAMTPRGGMHLFFSMPAGVIVTNSRCNLPKHVDVRGQGGYVIAAPSIRSDGAAYDWVGWASLAPAPQALIDCITGSVALRRAA